MESKDTKKVTPQYNNFHISASINTTDSDEGNFSTTLRVDLNLPSTEVSCSDHAKD